MYKKVEREKRDHSKLLKSLKKHFKRDEDEIEAEDEETQVKPMTLYQKKSDRRVALNRDYDEDTEPHSAVYGSDGHSTDENKMYGENSESNDEGYSSEAPEDDEEYEAEEKEEEEEDSRPMLPKAQRKRMSIAVLTKKLSKPRKRDE